LGKLLFLPLFRGVSAEGRRGVPSPLLEGWLPKADGVYPSPLQRGVCIIRRGVPFPSLRGVAAQADGVFLPLS